MDKIYANTLEKEIKNTVEKQGYSVYKCDVTGVFDADKKDAGIKKIEIILDGKTEVDEESEDVVNKTVIDKIKEIDEVRINVNNAKKEENLKQITDSDIKNLKKYLSEHYEIEKKVFDIKKR